MRSTSFCGVVWCLCLCTRPWTMSSLNGEWLICVLRTSYSLLIYLITNLNNFLKGPWHYHAVKITVLTDQMRWDAADIWQCKLSVCVRCHWLNVEILKADCCLTLYRVVLAPAALTLPIWRNQSVEAIEKSSTLICVIHLLIVRWLQIPTF